MIWFGITFTFVSFLPGASGVIRGTTSWLMLQTQFRTTQPAKHLDLTQSFPVTVQYSPIPSRTAFANVFPDTPASRREVIDDLIDHGVTLLQCPLPMPEKEAREVERYAQERGMGITWYIEKGLEGFKRDTPPSPGLYSERYRQLLRSRVDMAAEQMSRYPRLVNVFPMMDEPFHAGVNSFGVSAEEKAEFSQRFGYELPIDALAVRENARQWLDVINFRADYFPVAWRQVYSRTKQHHPTVDVIVNHDGHNALGGGVHQEAQLFVDDVFHWGGSYADVLSVDIYPYLMTDFRYGPNRELMLPRMAQTHYVLAQMRNVTRAYKLKMGFFFGTYHPRWFNLTESGKQQHWMSREMIYTAVAAGTDVLISGMNVPIDARHWEDLGNALKTLQKASPALLETKPVRARAAMLFPRTQCVQLQEEYWNVALSFETFQRAFGECDVVHEEQVARDGIGNYQILLLFDVKLLPLGVLTRIEEFVDSGGIVIADCMPNQDELRCPTNSMDKLFGVSDADTTRILWPTKMHPEEAKDPKLSVPIPPATQPSDRVRGSCDECVFDFPVVSPRKATPTHGRVLLRMASGAPALVETAGRTYFLGFCVQDTVFEAYRTGDVRTVRQIASLFDLLARKNHIRSHVHSTNPDIEVAVRANDRVAFLFIISHEPRDSADAHIRVEDLPFTIRSAVDIETGDTVSLLNVAENCNQVRLRVSAPTGSTRLVSLHP